MLERAKETLSVAEAEAILAQAYGDHITPTERTRAFAAAADIASLHGAHAQALAWIDWAVRETSLVRIDAPDVAETTHAAAIRIALAAGDPLQTRDYVRRYAGLALGWEDDPARVGVRLSPLDADCPDVIEDHYVRLRIVFGAPVEGASRVRPVRCFYAPLNAAAAPVQFALELYVTRSWIPSRQRMRGAVEVGLDPADAAARATIAERLPVVTTRIERDRSISDVGDIGYARYSRPGVDDVAMFVYATGSRDGTFVAARVFANTREWPPTALRARANAALASALNADIH